MERQRTIKKVVLISGVGLHTGRGVNVSIRPAPENTGVVFRRVDLEGRPAVKAAPENILERDTAMQRTSIKKGEAEVHTIEHLMGALSGLSIDNVFVDIDGMETPGLDGSTKDFAEGLQDAGIVEQLSPKRFIEIKRPVTCERNGSMVEARPDPRFRIDYELDFDRPWIKKQSFSVTIDSTSEFSSFFGKELAPSRTFCLEEEALKLLMAGLGKGANLDNTLVIGKNGPIKNELRFSDELVRHKVLDLLGDLYLLGGHIRGHIRARRSGHRLNAELVKKLAGVIA